MLLQTLRKRRQQSTAFLCFLMLSQSTPIEQQERPSSLTLPALLHPKASISQSLSRRITEMQVLLSTFSRPRWSSSLAVLLSTDPCSAVLEGVLKKRGSSMRWGCEGAMERLLRWRLNCRTSFSSASEPPMRKERLREGWWELWPLFLLSIKYIASYKMASGPGDQFKKYLNGKPIRGQPHRARHQPHRHRGGSRRPQVQGRRHPRHRHPPLLRRTPQVPGRQPLRADQQPACGRGHRGVLRLPGGHPPAEGADPGGHAARRRRRPQRGGVRQLPGLAQLREAQQGQPLLQQLRAGRLRQRQALPLQHRPLRHPHQEGLGRRRVRKVLRPGPHRKPLEPRQDGRGVQADPAQVLDGHLLAGLPLHRRGAVRPGHREGSRDPPAREGQLRLALQGLQGEGQLKVVAVIVSGTVTYSYRCLTLSLIYSTSNQTRPAHAQKIRFENIRTCPRGQ